MTSEYKVLKFLKESVANTEWQNKIMLVGGAVRDEVMGLKPKDLDFVVDGDIDSGIEFATWLAKYMGNYKPNSNPVIYARFGTAKLSLIHNKYGLPNIDLEFVAPRKEEYTLGSRKPIVTQGTLKDDVFRRDQTINSLMKNISTDEIIDLTGKGVDDIKNKVIRTTSSPDVIFKDDPLRMLRVIRMSVKLGFKIFPDVIPSIKKNSDLINTISKERITDELNKILVSPRPAQGIELLRETGLAEHILGQKFMSLIGMTQNKYHIDDVYNHTLKVLQGTPTDLKTRLMALFHDIGKSQTRTTSDNGDVHFYMHEKVGQEITRNIMTELKYSNDMIDSVVKGVGNHMMFKHGADDASKLTDKTLRKFKANMGGDLQNILDLIHSDNTAHADDANLPNQIFKVKERLMKLEIPNDDLKIKLPINGNDLIGLGLKPGPIFRQIMDSILDAWYENPTITKDDAIDIAKSYMATQEIKNKTR